MERLEAVYLNNLFFKIKKRTVGHFLQLMLRLDPCCTKSLPKSYYTINLSVIAHKTILRLTKYLQFACFI